MNSKQGVNIAFIGMSSWAQTACAEYLSRRLRFKRMEFDDGLVHFLRTIYGYHERFKLKKPRITEFYDTIYKLDNDIWLQHFTRRLQRVESDIVVGNVRYLNELEALKERGFTIVRVTFEPKKRRNIGMHVKTADKGTVALSMLYDPQFAVNYNVEYSVNFTKHRDLPQILNPILEAKGYNLTEQQ